MRKEVCRFMAMSTPSQRGLMTSLARRTGAMRGTTMKQISMKSRKNPRIKITIMTMTREV